MIHSCHPTKYFNFPSQYNTNVTYLLLTGILNHQKYLIPGYMIHITEHIETFNQKNI